MESVSKRVIFLSIILSLFTTLLIYFYITKVTKKPNSSEYTSVYVAARTLPVKTKITESDIKQIKINKELLNDAAILNKPDIIGKRLKDSIIEGEQILRERLADESNSTLSYKIPEGKRAVSINIVDQISVSNLLRPGDCVDIIASFEKEDVENAASKTVYPRITKTIVQNIEILAIGQDQIITTEKIKDTPKTITLAASPQDAEKLVYASQYGVLRLALRPANDNKAINTQGIIREDITSGKGVWTAPK